LTTTLSCPQCGGAITPGTGERVVRCGFCDAALFVDRAGVVGHYVLPWRLDVETAAANLRRWMAGNQTVKDLDRKATIGGGEAITFPLWLFRLATARGEATVVEPAAPTPIAGLADLAIPAGELVPFRGNPEGVLATPAAVPLDTARGWLGERVGREASARVSETALVEVPLWRFTYQYGGEPFTALVDAATGAVVAAIYPSKRETPFWGVAIVGTLLFLVLGAAITNPLIKLLAFGLAAVPVYGLAYWVARKV
jgi:hypothetical protein